MYRYLRSAISLAGLMILIGLAAPATTYAQDAQHNETDIAFIKRMTTRLQRTENEAERLGEYFQEMSGPASRNQMMGQDQYGRQTRTSSSNRESEYRRARSRMRSVGKKAEKEREKLVEMQRSGNSIDASDRERIESTVARLERDIADAERYIRLGVF